MFSAAQLSNFKGKKRITQETFDAAVQENITEFDMDPEEALTSAVEEFSAQGVDLSSIIKSVSGGNIAAHPITTAVAALQAVGDAGAVAAAADDIAAAVHAEGAGQVSAVLHRAGAAQALAASIAAAAADPAALLSILRALYALLASASRELQADFAQAHGAAAVHGALSSRPGSSVVAAALQVAAASAVKNEGGKAALMEAGWGKSSLEAMQQCAGDADTLQAACAVLCTLTNPDDESQPGSRAFPNARALAKEGAAKQLVDSLRGHAELPAEAVAALATALKQIAANEEICQEVAGAGGVQLALQILETGMTTILARPVCALVRQLVSSDGNKGLLVGCGGLQLLSALLAAPSSSPALLEQALGVLTNVTLRNPEAAAKALECGCLDAVLELMRVLLANSNGKENRGTTAVQRQACMALRNIAARSPDVRTELLGKGAEGLLRQIRAAYPSCVDAGSAALRDLGLAYN